jgi:4-hydroxy-tetrahydrodipicolinate synthase
MDPRQLSGIIPALATPFTADEELDEEALRGEVHVMLDAGAHGICVTGSTGEGHTLSVEESCRIATIVRDELKGRLPLIAGIIRDSTRDVVRYGLALKEVGVDALQVTPVHYLFAPTEDGTYAYYERIGREVGLPIVIYNVIPWNTLSPQTLLRLSEIDQVIGVKQSGGDIHKLADLLRMNNDRLRVFTAVDALLYPSFMLGAHGSISAILTILPDLCAALWDACQRGDHPAALALHERILPVWRAMEYPDMSARTKAAIALRGRTVGNPRQPILPVTDAVRREIADALDQAGVLPATVG